MSDIPQFRPHDPVDLEDQNMMLLVLEELCIAHMQRYWEENYASDSKDLPLLKAQDDEIKEDLALVLTGKTVDESRFKANNWVGENLSQHLKKHLTRVWQALEIEVSKLDMQETIQLALDTFVKEVERLVREDLECKKSGAKGLAPQKYITFMIEWSGLFSGKSEVLTEIGFMR